MLDWFRDGLLELQGIDSNKAKLERELKKQEKFKSKEKVFIPVFLKKMIQTLSAVYIVSCISMIRIVFNSGTFAMILKSGIQLVTAIAIFILLFFKNKKAELISIGLIILLIVLQNVFAFVIT